ncbi:hypothetical protein, partial [Pseudomonas sp. Kh7]|uniref:hypothetical protein n=1 Tax=Pseudomonas sp. Kh7 TaxID=2093743 RepID=UPI001C49C0AB
IFGHLNHKYLKDLSTHGIFDGLPIVFFLEGFFPGCALGKKHQDPFHKNFSKRDTSPLEIVHSDLIAFPTPLSMELSIHLP